MRKIVGKREEKVSLQTRDSGEAKQCFAKALAEVEARWANLRTGPKLLNEREAHELAVVAYDQWLQMYRDNPSQLTRWDVVAGDRLFGPPQTREQIRAASHRLLGGASAKTVKDSDLAGLKTVFGWAVMNRRMHSNPAEGLTIKVGKSRKLRSKGFYDREASAILKHARNSAAGRAAPKLALAKRWVPWLCAFTGARVRTRTYGVWEGEAVRLPPTRLPGYE